MSYRFMLILTGLAVLALVASSCGESKAFKPKPKPKQVISHYEIVQPNSTYAADDVIIWSNPDQGQRAFLLKPGTKVEVLKNVDTAEGKTMLQIKTADERTGWVPNTHCVPKYK